MRTCCSAALKRQFTLQLAGPLSCMPEMRLYAHAGDDPSVRTLPLTISSLELLTRPPLAPPAPAFFLRWASLPAGGQCMLCSAS